MISITVNGEERTLDHGISISEFLRIFDLHERMVVVEHNCEILPREKFSATEIRSGDNLEIVQMMAGG